MDRRDANKRAMPDSSTRRGDLPTITASQIGEYEYCSRAWWYRHVVKLPLPKTEGYGRLAAGTEAHARHSRWVSSEARLRSMGLVLALAGLAALALVAALLFLVK